jgi:hypothetical protein
MANHPVRIADASFEPDSEREGFASTEDEAIIRGRLADLGYLD